MIKTLRKPRLYSYDEVLDIIGKYERFPKMETVNDHFVVIERNQLKTEQIDRLEALGGK